MARVGFWAIESHQIRFGKDGQWYADAERIQNQRIADLFSRHVRQEADGSYWLRIGDEKARIVVEDTPYVVTRVHAQAGGGFLLTLNDGSQEPLIADHLRFGEGHVLYSSVKEGLFQARFLRAPQAELLFHAVERPDGHIVLPLGGQADWVLS